MTYAYEDCGFSFCLAGAVTKFHSCEKNNICSAIKEETQRLQILLEQGKPTLLKEEQTQ